MTPLFVVVCADGRVCTRRGFLETTVREDDAPVLRLLADSIHAECAPHRVVEYVPKGEGG